jgi:hypothetical protein
MSHTESNPNLAKPKLYSQEDIQEILQIAIERQTDDRGDNFTQEQLLEIGLELGIDEASIANAEKAWFSQQNRSQKEKDFQLYRQYKLQKKLTKFLLLNGIFISLNLLFVGYLTWSLYIVAWKTYQTQGEEYQQELQKWERNQNIKQSLNNFWQRVQQGWQA